MQMTEIIAHKKLGKELTNHEIQFFINGILDGSIPEYQISALLMAIYFQKMTTSEQTTLTMAMLNSGDRLDLSKISGTKVDKHSTGGVGDKTSLPLAAMVAALGIPVPMVSGRGLGHTGGTLDKLEAIPGYRVELTDEEFIKQVAKINLAIIGAAGNIAPADKKLYALRDVTATVDSIPLITSSILSKKLASGTDALVLDVKTGRGAFMKEEQDAIELAKSMVSVANQAGVKCMAIISDMNQPLGNKIGNSLEIEETIDVLKGNGPTDLLALIYALGSSMVVLGGKANDLGTAKAMLQQTIVDGTAFEKFREMVTAQGGNGQVMEHPEIMPQARYHIDIRTNYDGLIQQMNADELGIAAMKLGGGRVTKDDQLDYSVGLTLHAKVGSEVRKGDVLVTIASNSENIDDVIQLVQNNIVIGHSADSITLLRKIVTPTGKVQSVSAIE